MNASDLSPVRWIPIGLIALVIAVVVGIGLHFYERGITVFDRESAVHAHTALVARAGAVQARARSDSVATAFRVMAVDYRAMKAQRAQAIAASDAAVTAAHAVEDSARRVLSDSTATVQALRVQVTALLAAAEAIDTTFHAERRASDSTVTRADSAIGKAQESIVAKDTALAAGEKAYQAEIVVAKDAGHRPPWYARAFRSVAGAGVTLLCGAGGYLVAGPIGAAGGVTVCAAIGGILHE